MVPDPQAQRLHPLGVGDPETDHLKGHQAVSAGSPGPGDLPGGVHSADCDL